MSTPLQDSITHWQRMYKFAKVGEFDVEAPTAYYCVLCTKHMKSSGYNHDTWCLTCPVVLHSDKHKLCRNTPYSAAYRAFLLVDENPTPKHWAIWRKSAKKEIEFLQSIKDTDNDYAHNG